MVRAIQTGKVSADIHLIRSTDEMPNPQIWLDFTTRNLKIHQGSGQHTQMLVGENLPKNTHIIRTILNKGEHQ